MIHHIKMQALGLTYSEYSKVLVIDISFINCLSYISKAEVLIRQQRFSERKNIQFSIVFRIFSSISSAYSLAMPSGAALDNLVMDFCGMCFGFYAW